jgi:hypothetical protein
MAARALVHNGCTTGVEAFVMRTPAFSYRPSICPAIDDSFYVLPHGLSHQCVTAEELLDRIRAVLDGRLGAADGEARSALVHRYLTGQDGALACERMVDVLEAIARERPGLPAPPLPTRVLGRLLADGRFLVKRLKAYFPRVPRAPRVPPAPLPGRHRGGDAAAHPALSGHPGRRHPDSRGADRPAHLPHRARRPAVNGGGVSLDSRRPVRV